MKVAPNHHHHTVSHCEPYIFSGIIYSLKREFLHKIYSLYRCQKFVLYSTKVFNGKVLHLKTCFFVRESGQQWKLDCFHAFCVTFSDTKRNHADTQFCVFRNQKWNGANKDFQIHKYTAQRNTRSSQYNTKLVELLQYQCV